jgi:hypothetical protein
MQQRILCFIFLLLSTALAQVDTRGEITFGIAGTFSEAFSADVGWQLKGNVQAEYRVAPVVFRLALEPAVRFSEEVKGELGLAELYAHIALEDADLSAGLERLPLEYARLSLPFTIEPSNAFGQRRGVPSVRISYFTGDWRVRGAVNHQAGGLAPMVSVKRSFGAFELEGHALYAGRPVFGVGGSGLAGGLVVYGEAWLLLTPLEARGAVGLSGFWEESLWTLEAAYAPGAVSPTAHPQLLGQLSLPQGTDASWNLTAGVAYASGGALGQASVGYSLTTPDERLLSASVSGLLTAQLATLTVQLGVTGFF